MSGYFSQLAHQTGLRFEPGAVSSGASSVQRLDAALPAPPHVEEIIFSPAPAPTPVDDRSHASTRASSGDEISLFDRDPAATARPDGPPKPNQLETQAHDPTPGVALPAERVIDASPDAAWEESHVEFIDADSPKERSPAAEAPVVRRDGSFSAPRQSAPRESLAAPRQSVARVENQLATRGPQSSDRHEPRPELQDADQPRPIGDRAPTDVVRVEHGERESIVHQSLEEVRAWVSAPPELDGVDVEPPRDPAHPPSRDGAARSSGVRNRELALETEVQDLSLSIGTISIVIEGPKQTAPAVQPALPKVDSSAARPASEPTRLSRYYLEPW